MTYFKLLIAAPLFILAACAAKPLMPSAGTVFLSKDSPPGECHFTGDVQGTQGNIWLAQFTTDANLIEGARNEVRNAASAMDANYVQIETESFSVNTGGIGGTHSAVVIGHAYRCDDTRTRVK